MKRLKNLLYKVFFKLRRIPSVISQLLLYPYYWIWNRKHNRDIYIVYTMGKVGSSSVFSSLKQRLPTARIYHTHFLSDHYLKEVLPKKQASFHPNIDLGFKIRRAIKDNRRGRVKIITVVRDPVARNLSATFQHWKLNFDRIEDVPLSDLEKDFRNRSFDYPLHWYDTEFKAFLRFDIYKFPFDKNKNYQTYTTDQFDILALKLESLNSTLKTAIKEFSGLDIEQVDSNLSANKRGGRKYKELKRSLSVSRSKLDDVYGSRYMRHFYSESEIDKLSTKWSGVDTKIQPHG